MTAQCRRCGQQWPFDPAWQVECDECHAKIGSPCKRPSGHGVWGNQPHDFRDRKAMRAGLLQRCPGAPAQQTTQSTQPAAQRVYASSEAHPDARLQPALL